MTQPRLLETVAAEAYRYPLLIRRLLPQRHLHSAGFWHKDLYLCHHFVARGGSEITLIDLARLTRTTSRRLRVKDLAALAMSACGIFSRTDMMAGLKRYGGDRRLARAVLKKAARMARHIPRNVRDAPCT